VGLRMRANFSALLCYAQPRCHGPHHPRCPPLRCHRSHLPPSLYRHLNCHRRHHETRH
jgi:hypothetical protein